MYDMRLARLMVVLWPDYIRQTDTHRKPYPVTDEPDKVNWVGL